MYVVTRIDFTRNVSLFRENDHIKTIKIKNELNFYQIKQILCGTGYLFFYPVT